MESLPIRCKGSAIPGRNGLTWESLPVEFNGYFPEVPVKYLDRLSQLAGVAVGKALGTVLGALKGGDHRDFAVVFGTAFGALDSVTRFDTQALKGGPNSVNPMDFPNTVANAAGSLLGIWLQLKGPNITLTNGPTSFLDAMGFAWEAWNAGLFRRCLVGAGDALPPFFSGSEDRREGACVVLGGDAPEGDPLFRVEDHFSLQLTQEEGLPGIFKGRWENFWDSVDWWEGRLGPFGSHLSGSLARDPLESAGELGREGWEALDSFLASSASRGVVAAFSREERKVSCLKIAKGRQR